MGKEQWFYTQNGQEYGPVSSAMLKELAASGQLRPEDFLWREGLGEWVQARKTKLFKARDAEAAPLAPAPARPATPMQALGVEGTGMVEAAVAAPPAGVSQMIAPPALAAAPLEYHSNASEKLAQLRSTPYWIVGALLLIAFLMPVYSKTDNRAFPQFAPNAPRELKFTTIQAIASEDGSWRDRALLLQPVLVAAVVFLLALLRGRMRSWMLLVAALLPMALMYLHQPDHWWPKTLWMLRSAEEIYPLVGLVAMLAGTWWFLYRPKRGGGASLAFFGAFLSLMTLAIPWVDGPYSRASELMRFIHSIREPGYGEEHAMRLLRIVMISLRIVSVVLCVLLLARRRWSVAFAAFWALVASALAILVVDAFGRATPTGKWSADVLPELLEAGKYAAWFGGQLMAQVVQVTDLLVRWTPRQESLPTSASANS